MKKQLIAIAVASATLATASIASANSGWFAGGQLANSKQDFSVSSYRSDIEQGTKTVLDEIDNPTQFGARFGKYINNNVRLYTTLSYGEDSKSISEGNNYAKAKLTTSSALFSADYLFGTHAIKPFVGLSLGGQLIEGKVTENNSSASDDSAGFLYGGQAGVAWQFADNWNLEGGYQYLKSTADYSVIGTKVDLNSTQNLYLSVDYMF